MTVDARPKAEVFSLRTELLSEGRTNIVVSRTDLMTVTVKVYSEGGENALHTHLTQDHAFAVLQGEATFYDEADHPQVLHKWEGISLPRGAYYWFKSTGDENLVLLRFGANLAGSPPGDSRVNLEGKPLPSDSAENKHIPGVPIPGRFFGDLRE
ncbi:MAG: cupin domain-containing protein [Chloroflexi bacterium]|nr:cupin domain-containing protein [Chloroflexota bacterium]